MTRSIAKATALLGIGLFLGAGSHSYLSAQAAGTGTLSGTVWDSTTGGPLIRATIHVLGTEFFGETNLYGEYSIAGLPIGYYGVTFSHGRADDLDYSPPAYIIGVAEGETAELPLFVPTLPSILTESCDGLEEGRGALTGYVRVRYRGTPLPQATVKLSWAAKGDIPGGEVAATTDIDGVYRICEVPAGVPITAEADFLGLAVRTSGLIVGANESRQRDFDIDVIEVGNARVKLDRQARERLIDGETDVQGRLTDVESSEPISGALVRIRNHDESALTDQDGRFIFRDVQAGIRVVDVQHLIYGEQATEVLLTRGGATDVDVQLRQQALELGEILVTARKQDRLDRRIVALGTRKDVMVREQIEEISRTSVDVGDLMRRFPGIRVTYPNVSGERLLCISRGRGGRDRSSRQSIRELTMRAPGCDTLPVFVDGRPLYDPELTLATIPPGDIESIELVTSTGAVSYAGAQNGAIVIYTRGNGPWAVKNRRR